MKKALLFAIALLATAALAQNPPPVRLRGTIEKIDPTTIVLKERNGDTVTLAIADNFTVSEVVPVDPATIQSGVFVGTAALPGADGTLSALEVLVFPEAMRGTGEGHSQWDLQPGSTMTNATVTELVPGAKGSSMTALQGWREDDRRSRRHPGRDAEARRPLAPRPGRQGARHRADAQRSADGAARDRGQERLRAADVTALSATRCRAASSSG